MPKKKKNALPSGSFRVQVYDYTDKAGKKHYSPYKAPGTGPGGRLESKSGEDAGDGYDPV